MAKRRFVTSAVVFNESGHVLLVKQAAPRLDWELPGGQVKRREAIVDAIVREVMEETGLAVAAERMIGVFDIPAQRYCDFVLLCRAAGAASARDPLRPKLPEIQAVDFFAVDALPQPIRPYTVARIRDAVDGVIHAVPITLERGEWLDE
jgi:8-oxo-dGTP diphosphatase